MENTFKLSRDIIMSDDFLMLDDNQKLLYLLYCANANEDGIIKNPYSLAKMIEATTADFNALLENGFILNDEDGFIICHWDIHQGKREYNFLED